MTTVLDRCWSFGRGLYGRLLHSFFFMTRGLTVGVRAVVRSKEGKFLLVRHTYIPGWYFPGGGVEKGETAESTLRKELRQETGLLLVNRPTLYGVFFNRAISKRDHVLVYLCDVDADEAARVACFEIAEIGFFDLDDLPQGTDPGTERRMREMMEGLERADVW